MASNQPGGNKSPWGRRPGQGGTDLDERVKNWQRKLEAVLRAASPGSESSRSLVATAVLIAVALWLGSGFFQIAATDRGVVERFGKLVEVRSQGWGWRWPWPIETLQKVDVTSISTKEYTPAVLTADGNLVDLRLDVDYRLADPLKVLFGARDPQNTIEQVSDSVIRQVVGQTTLQQVLAGADRPRLARSATAEIQRRLDAYDSGVKITAVNLADVEVPDAVIAAQQDVGKAHTDHDRTIAEAQAYASGVVPTAKGDAAKILQQADGYKAQVVALAQGKSSQFTQIDRAYKRAPEVTRERMYLQTMESVLERANKVIVATQPHATGSNVFYLPLDKLIGHTSGPAAEPGPVPSGASAGADSGDTENAGTVTVEGRARGER
ncbi:MAG: FtsH protease activity modulator HflK [Steroidobacteraceae bacterium]